MCELIFAVAKLVKSVIVLYDFKKKLSNMFSLPSELGFKSLSTIIIIIELSKKKKLQKLDLINRVRSKWFKFKQIR